MAKYKIIEKHGKKRKSFIVGNNNITAVGIIFYKDDELLLIYNKKRQLYEDFGGKVEIHDKYIYETAAREAEEESNKIFLFNDLVKKLEKIKEKYVYVDHSKYAVYFLELNDKIDTSKFGDFEDECKIHRTVEWIPIKHIKKRKINLIHRLKHKSVIHKIFNLYKKKTSSKNKKKIKINYQL